MLAVSFGLLLSGCVRDRCSRFMLLLGCVPRGERATPEDLSILFPSFHEQAPVRVGLEGRVFELDGAALRAMQIAADDFLPPGTETPPCWRTQAAHTYRVLRQGEVLFVRIDENPAACGRELPALHSGAQYALSLDGRILRRLVDGQPDGTAPSLLDSTAPGVQAEPGTIPGYEPSSQAPPDTVAP